MKIIQDAQAFKEHLLVWDSKKMAMNGFKVVKGDNGLHQPVVYDYFNPDIGYLNNSDSYTTWRGAFGAIGAVFDEFESQDY